MQQEYSRRQFGAQNPPYQRVFFEFSDDPASQPPSFVAGGSGGADVPSADPHQVAFLQSQVRDKDRRIQALSVELTETREQADQAQQELTLTRAR